MVTPYTKAPAMTQFMFQIDYPIYDIFLSRLFVSLNSYFPHHGGIFNGHKSFWNILFR